MRIPDTQTKLDKARRFVFNRWTGREERIFAQNDINASQYRTSNATEKSGSIYYTTTLLDFEALRLISDLCPL